MYIVMMWITPFFSVMGHVLCNNLTALGGDKRLDRDAGCRASVEKMKQLMEKPDATPREKLHAQASEAFVKR